MTYSFWEKDIYFSKKDLIIVGAGFVGLWTALVLKKQNPKMSIFILDSGILPNGASTRNAGFACFGSITEQMMNRKNLGDTLSLDFIQNRYLGIKKITQTFKAEDIDYNEWGGHEIILSDNNLNSIDWMDEINKMNKFIAQILPFNQTYFLQNNKIDLLGLANVKQLIFTPYEGQLHSGKLHLELTKLVTNLGVIILKGIDLLGFDNGNNSVNLYTNMGNRFSSSRLLICTNGFCKKLLPQIDVIPGRGQILLTEDIENLKIKGTFHAEEGYYYFRNVGKKVLLGGGRQIDWQKETTYSIDISEAIQNNLEKFLYNHILPECQVKPKIINRWSGIMGFGAEKTPIIEEIYPNIYLAVRLSGMGVALAPIMADIVQKKFFP